MSQMAIETESLRAERVPAALRAAEGLTLLAPVLAGPIGRTLTELLSQLLQPPGSPCPAFGRLVNLLWRQAVDSGAPAVAAAVAGAVTGDLLQDYLLHRLIGAETPFSRLAERGGSAAIPPALRDTVAGDLRRLQSVWSLHGAILRRLVAAVTGEEAGGLPGWDVWPPRAEQAGSEASRAPAAVTAYAAYEVHRRLAAAADWSHHVDDLAAHFATHGSGPLGRFAAFVVRPGPGAVSLQGIGRPDPIRLADLIGYEEPRGQVVRNTEQFLAGLPAQNLLLYGERGTGKSSTIKALIHTYASRGLRLVQLPKRHLALLPDVMRYLGGRPQRFILFVDDLAFEEHEGDYKELKSALEGSLEIQPDNVLVYVTSNRRHLVRETFAHHAGSAEEVRPQDIRQEQLSLADRFGKTIIFGAPDQDLFVRIVQELATRRHLPVPAAELEQMALRWALWHNGRSARTARQFVDHLQADLAFRAEPPQADRA